jgi:hypothetical protein
MATTQNCEFRSAFGTIVSDGRDRLSGACEPLLQSIFFQQEQRRTTVLREMCTPRCCAEGVVKGEDFL